MQDTGSVAQRRSSKDVPHRPPSAMEGRVAVRRISVLQPIGECATTKKIIESFDSSAEVTGKIKKLLDEPQERRQSTQIRRQSTIILPEKTFWPRRESKARKSRGLDAAEFEQAISSLKSTLKTTTQTHAESDSTNNFCVRISSFTLTTEQCYNAGFFLGSHFYRVTFPSITCSQEVNEKD